MEILIFSLSILSTVCIILTSYLKGIKKILFFLSMANLTLATGYLLDTSYAGAALCGIGAVTSIISGIFDAKEKPIPLYVVLIYMVVSVTANLFTFTGWYCIFSLLAAVVFNLSIIQKTGKHYRYWTLTNVILWILYDIFSASYGSLLSHVIVLIFMISGIILEILQEKKAVNA